MTYLILLAVSVAIAVLAGRFLGWDSLRRNDESEHLNKYSDYQRAMRDMRAMRGGK